MDKSLKGQRYKNASGRETYEIFKAEPDLLQEIARILRFSFGFEQQREALVGLDCVYMDFANGAVAVFIGWNNWSGCFICANNAESDQQVTAIGDFMDAELKTTR